MSTDLIPANDRNALEAIDRVARDYGLMALDGKSEMEKTYILATGMSKVREMLTDHVMRPIMALQGSSLGFRTDADSKGGYDVETVRMVAAEAFLRGFRMTGNEVNIIAGRFYAAKDGCRRRVLEWPGLTEFIMEIGIPKDEGGRALVEGVATWKLHGTPDSLERRGKTAIPIRRNAGMGDDAILGKAERKMYASVLSKLSNFVMPEGEVDADLEAARQPKVKRSLLNDMAEESPASKQPQFDVAEQGQLVGEWCQMLDAADGSDRITELHRESAKSDMLSADSKRLIGDYANKRRAALRGRR